LLKNYWILKNNVTSKKINDYKFNSINISMDIKAVILIPAYNEENWIGQTIDLINATGINAKVIVINDGSTDKTAEIAKSKGAEVVSLRRNMGKTAAFFYGVKHSLKYNPTAIVTLDADMLKLTKFGLDGLINRAHTATNKGEVKQIISRTYELDHIGDKEPNDENPGVLEFSGVRSFSIPAIYKLLRSPFKRFAQGFSLEKFQNLILISNTETSNYLYTFWQRPAITGATASSGIQNKQLNDFVQKKQKLEKLIRLRKESQTPHVQIKPKKPI